MLRYTRCGPRCFKQRLLLSRQLTCTARRLSDENPDKAYSKTLLLPKTSFSIWSDPSTRENQVRKKTCEALYRWQRENAKGPTFVLHDGPPYANGDLHMGHALNKILKDVINRFHVIQGRRVHYVPGWDCHGLPIENKAAQKLRKNPLTMAPDSVRREAKVYAEKQVANQRETFRQLGVMADWDNPDATYRTLDPAFEIRQLRVFQKMVASGLIYRAHRPVYYSPSSRSALAESELSYQDDHVSHSVYVMFNVDAQGLGMSSKLKPLCDRFPSQAVKIVAWTTTPWTLTANMGIAVNAEMVYVAVKRQKSSGLLLVAKERLPHLCHVLGECEVLAEILGSDLVDLAYDPVFSSASQEASRSAPYRVMASSHVTSNSGTGFVHCAPAHGMEDYELFRGLGLLQSKMGDVPPERAMLCHVDSRGKFSDAVSEVVGPEAARELSGKDVLRDGGKAVVDMLETKGALLTVEKIKHSYPYDWKTKEPVIMLATSQWFANLGRIKDDALQALQDVQFYPPISRNRLESFVRSRSEWCISRQRVWGVPIPALYCASSGSVLLDSESLEHIISVLEAKGEGVSYWWNGSIEEFIPPSERAKGLEWTKGTDTMDVWFDSGSSWAMLPAQNSEEGRPLAHVCVEGSDQHRGWFQSQLLTKIATSAGEGEAKAPYGALITHGMVLDQDGKKMSKTLGNIINPMTVVKGGKGKSEPALGADVLRLWAATVEYGRDMALGPTVLTQTAEALRKLRNTARFILGNIGPARPRLEQASLNLMDRYVMHELYKTEKAALDAYATYNFAKVVSSFTSFTNTTLSALYFDVTKDCLYADAADSTRRTAIVSVLYQVLQTANAAMAPILPHLAEEVHEKLGDIGSENDYSSVFAKGWTPLAGDWYDPQVEQDMKSLLAVRTTVLSLLEKAREQKHIGSSLEADVDIIIPGDASQSNGPLHTLLRREEDYLKTLFIVSDATITDEGSLGTSAPEWTFTNSVAVTDDADDAVRVRVRPASMHKCPRCWTFTRKQEESVCTRCESVLASAPTQ